MVGFVETVKLDLAAHSHRRGRGVFLAAIFFSPGFILILSHRIASVLYKKKWGRFLGRVLWRFNVIFSGCHLGLRSEIGAGLLLPHPVGIVIGDGVTVGRNVIIYQSVTLGAASHSRAQYPVVGSNVVIYPGSVVVGQVHVGDGATIGANSFVKSDEPAGSVFGCETARALKGKSK